LYSLARGFAAGADGGDLSGRPGAARGRGADPALDQYRIRQAGDDPGSGAGRPHVGAQDGTHPLACRRRVFRRRRGACARRAGGAVHQIVDAQADRAAGAAARALRRMSSFMALALEEAERGDPTAHAEMLVLRAGAVSKSRARLDDCDLYVTLEPCAMCAAAISLAHVRRLYFGAYDHKGGAVEHGPRWF